MITTNTALVLRIIQLQTELAEEKKAHEKLKAGMRKLGRGYRRARALNSTFKGC